VLPLLAWSGLPAPASWPWIAASTALNLATVTALLRAYEGAGYGFAYPLVRALSVLLVAALAAGLSGEWPSGYGLAGIGLIAAALVTLALETARQGTPASLVWIGAAGAATAACVLCDAQGVRRAGSALSYCFAVSIANALVFAALQGMREGLRQGAARHWLPALPIAVASIVSYLLILWVWSRAPIAPAAALRDTSAVIAILIAVLWLKEPFTRPRLAAVLLSAAAVPLLRLA
jgi:drug/metabolite transporter (DMT)-like permease